MLYNIEKKKIKELTDCTKCPYFCKGKCNGIGKKCFPYDYKTQTIIDTITKLPLKIKEED